MSPSPDSLRRELGSAPPPALARLSERDRERLVELLAGARERQDRALRSAIDEGLSFVPKLARGAVKRVLFG